MTTEAQDKFDRVGFDTSWEELESLAHIWDASLDQDWEGEKTTLTFRDGSKIILHNESQELG